jgi:HEAT repeat protein
VKPVTPIVPLLSLVLSGVIGQLCGPVGANPLQSPDTVSEALRTKAVRVLRTALADEEKWIKVHAAEALLSLGYPQGVTRRFQIELASKGGEPEYRIGIWRVLAQAAHGDRQRGPWVRKIVAAFVDTNGPDRLHAAETLAKLGYRARAGETDTFELAGRTGRGPLAANARWILANTGRIEDTMRLAELLDSDDLATRADAAYAIRQLSKLSTVVWKKLTAAVVKAPRDDGARIYLVGAAFVHAPLDQKADFKTELLTYARSGTNDEKYEACAALARAGRTEDLPILVGLLDNGIPDVRVGAAHAVLWIGRRRL